MKWGKAPRFLKPRTRWSRVVRLLHPMEEPSVLSDSEARAGVDLVYKRGIAELQEITGSFQ